jgi:hypothetical protein
MRRHMRFLFSFIEGLGLLDAGEGAEEEREDSSCPRC